MINQSDCTIIIPHLGRTEKQRYAVKECLKSLDETVPEMKKVVVTNGSIPQTFLNEFVGDIHIKEQGQCKAVNAGVAVSSTPWVLVLNDDMVFPPGWFDRLTYNLSDDIMCVSPQLVEPQKGAPSFIEYFCGGAGGDFNKQKFLQFVFDLFQKERTRPIRRGFNLPFLIKKEVFDLISGYDTVYDPWGASGDTDLQCKIELAGVKTWQNTNCLVYHFGQTSESFHPSHQSDWQKNYDYFREKWGFERPSGQKDAWFSKNLINYEKLKYRPFWMNHYVRTNPMQNSTSA